MKLFLVSQECIGLGKRRAAQSTKYFTGSRQKMEGCWTDEVHAAAGLEGVVGR